MFFFHACFVLFALSGECVISLDLAHSNKNLKRWTSIIALRWTSVTAPCYSSVLFRKQRKTHPRGMRACQPKRRTEKRGPRPNFGSSFYMLFLLPLGLPYVNWASQECCFFTWGAHFSPQTFLCSIFEGFSFPCLLATTLLDSFSLF